MGLFGKIFKKSDTSQKTYDVKVSMPSPILVTTTASPRLPPPKPVTTPAACPSCGVILETVPQRKKKCSHCGKDIYVRTDPFKRAKILLGHRDALSIDAINTLGFTEEEYRTEAEELAHSFKVSVPTIGDVVWGIFSKKELDSFKRGDWIQAQLLYYVQARLLYDLGEGFFKVLQESAKCTLYHYQTLGINKVEISPAATSCSKCQLLRGKALTIKEALEAMPIPVKDCEHNGGWCRCLYQPIVV